MTRYDVLVAGEINPDLILSGDVVPAFGQVEKLVDSASLAIGSSSVIFACGAARLGLKVVFVGVCGDDLFGRYMLDQMGDYQIDTTHVIVHKDGQTGLSVILNRGADRAILTYPGLIPALRASDVQAEYLGQTRHLHIASYFLQVNLQPGLPELFRRARSLGVTTSLDPNFDPSGQWLGFDQLYPWVNVLLPNQAEACSLAGKKDIDLAARGLASRVETLAVKLGPQGALGVREGETVRSGAVPVRLMDSVGAGDSFDAGFIYGYLQNWDMAKSLRLACVCGALSTRKAGGVAAQPDLTEALQYL